VSAFAAAPVSRMVNVNGDRLSIVAQVGGPFEMMRLQRTG